MYLRCIKYCIPSLYNKVFNIDMSSSPIHVRKTLILKIKLLNKTLNMKDGGVGRKKGEFGK